MWEWLKKLFGCCKKEESTGQSEMPEQAPEPQVEEKREGEDQ